MSRMLIILLNFSLLFFVALTGASPFTITVKEGTTLPTVTSSSENSLAYYTITNNTSTTREDNFIKYTPLSVAQELSGCGNICGRTFTLAPHESCTLQLRIFGGVDANARDPHEHVFVCLKGGYACTGIALENSLNVKNVVSVTVSPDSATHLGILETQQFTATAHYDDSTTEDVTSRVSWSVNNGSIAEINTDGLLSPIAGGEIVVTARFLGVNSDSTPLTVVSSYAYVTTVANNLNGNDLIYICPLTHNGLLGLCTRFSDDSFAMPMSIALNAERTGLYIANYTANVLDGAIAYCPLIDGGSNIGTCVENTDSTFHGTTAVTLNADNTYAYVSNRASNTISICPISPSDGSLEPCTSVLNSTFNMPADILIDLEGKLRVVNPEGNTVSICTLSAEGDEIIECTADTGHGTFSSPVAISYNPDGTFFYVANSGNQTLSICDAESCISDANVYFDGEKTGLFMSSASGYVYTANYAADPSVAVSVCLIDPDTGRLSDCTSSSILDTHDDQIINPLDIVVGEGT